MAGRFLTERDRDFILELARKVARVPTQGSNFTNDFEEDHLTPETYVALPQSAGGIPGLTTGPPDVPGSDTCDIYKINADDELVDAGFTRKVYNLSTTVIPQDWVQTNRTKYGKWLAVIGGTSSVGIATVIRCQVNQSTVAITDNTFAVTGVSVISPDGAAIPVVTTVNNVFHYPSVIGNECIAFLDAGTWYGIPEPPMEIVSATTTTDYDVGTHKFNAATTDIVVFSKAAEASPVTWHSASQNVVVTSVEKDGANLNFNTEDVYGIEASTNLTGNTWEVLTTVDPVTDIDYNNSGSDHNSSKKETRGVQVFSQNGSGGAWGEDATWTTNPDQTWHETQEETLVISVDRNSGNRLQLRYQTEKTHALEAFDTTANVVWETMTTLDPVTDIDYITGTPSTFNKKETRGVHVFSTDGSAGVWTEDASWTSPASNIWHTMINATNVTSVYAVGASSITWKDSTTFYVMETIVSSNGSHTGTVCP